MKVVKLLSCKVICKKKTESGERHHPSSTTAHELFLF